MSVVLVRHGEPDWNLVAGPAWKGAANDFAPLTAPGRQQARDAGSTLLAGGGVERVLSSPMTRALETAHIIAGVLDVPVQVELRLREWLPDETYSWTTAEEVTSAYADMMRHDGKRPMNHDLHWEPLDVVRERALSVLQPYLLRESRVVAVCHEVLIHAVTDCPQTPHAGRRVLQADGIPAASCWAAPSARRADSDSSPPAFQGEPASGTSGRWADQLHRSAVIRGRAG